VPDPFTNTHLFQVDYRTEFDYCWLNDASEKPPENNWPSRVPPRFEGGSISSERVDQVI